VAARFRARADRVGVVDRRITGQLATLTFEGPAATQFRQVMDAEHQRLNKLTATLQQLAAILERLANELESDPVGGYAALRGYRA
jgi:hypothetical protein